MTQYCREQGERLDYKDRKRPRGRKKIFIADKWSLAFDNYCYSYITLLIVRGLILIFHILHSHCILHIEFFIVKIWKGHHVIIQKTTYFIT